MGDKRSHRNKGRRGELDAVLALRRYGIQPSEALKLAKYDEFSYFLERCVEDDNKDKIIAKLELAEVVRMAMNANQSKGSSQAYSQWYLNLRDQLKPKPKREKLSLFEKLKGNKLKKNLNVFERLRGE